MPNATVIAIPAFAPGLMPWLWSGCDAWSVALPDVTEAMVTELDDGVGVAAAVALHVLCPRDLARTVHLPVVADLPAPWPGLSVNQQGTLVVTFRWTRTDPVLGSASWACAWWVTPLMLQKVYSVGEVKVDWYVTLT